MKYFGKSERTTHTISQNRSLHNIPSNSNRRDGMTAAVDLRPRCASCGKGRRR